MLVVCDVGNTNVVFGFFEGESLVSRFRLKSDPGRTVDEYRALLHSFRSQSGLPALASDGAIVASVVPPITQTVLDSIAGVFGVVPSQVGPGVRTGLAIRTKEPTAVGADRIVNAVAAKQLYGAPAIVVDFGTATSVDYINSDGEYEGGAIAPGLQTSLEALVEHTAKLPRIEIHWPSSMIGRTTTEAMQVGAVVGYVSMVDGLLERQLAEVGSIRWVVGTGGIGHLLCEHSKYLTTYDADLTLKGLAIIARRNRA